MTVFVTGGAGYIGTHVILELISQGYDVVAADNFVNSKPEAISRIRKLSGKNFPFYETDIRFADGLASILTAHDVDCIIHLAGLKAVGESVKKPLDYYENNIDSTLELLRAAELCGVNKIVFSSSATVYSGDNEMPLTEQSRVGNCTNPYGWTKFMGEQIFTDYAASKDGVSVALLRYFNPIGAHESGLIGEDPSDVPNNLMPYIAQTAVGRLPHLNVFGDDYDTSDGTGVRDYIHVVDLAAGHVAAIKYLEQNEGVSAFNLGTGKGVSVLELVSAFEEATGTEVPKIIAPRRPGDLAVCYACTDKAAKLLGWSAKKTIVNACEDTWRWQKNNPNGYD